MLHQFGLDVLLKDIADFRPVWDGCCLRGLDSGSKEMRYYVALTLPIMPVCIETCISNTFIIRLFIETKQMCEKADGLTPMDVLVINVRRLRELRRRVLFWPSTEIRLSKANSEIANLLLQSLQ